MTMKKVKKVSFRNNHMKTRVCPEYRRGKCFKGSKCVFLHEKTDSRPSQWEQIMKETREKNDAECRQKLETLREKAEKIRLYWIREKAFGDTKISKHTKIGKKIKQFIPLPSITE